MLTRSGSKGLYFYHILFIWNMFILMNTTGIFQLKSPENDILETIFVQYTEKNPENSDT